MFGHNPIEPIVNKTDGDKLRIVRGSPFVTIQGEGPYLGHRATFLRLHGCNLRCTFCDTEFSDTSDPTINTDYLIEHICDLPPRLVVVTGGEPLRQNILPLCDGLRSRGLKVQIETAGTLWIDGLENVAEVIVSPKTPVINKNAYVYAKAFKYIISTQQQFINFVPIMATQPGAEPRALAFPREDAPVYLSPMDEYDEVKNQGNRTLVASLAITHGCIAGIQLHKFLGLD